MAEDDGGRVEHRGLRCHHWAKMSPEKARKSRHSQGFDDPPLGVGSKIWRLRCLPLFAFGQHGRFSSSPRRAGIAWEALKINRQTGVEEETSRPSALSGSRLSQRQFQGIGQA